MSPRRYRLPLLIVAQFLLCLLETYLILRISWIGRFGIATVHREYSMLRSGWKTFLLLFIVQLTIIITLYIVEKRYPRKIATIVTAVFLLLGIIGLFITFQDFLHTYTHRLLKERFHTGFYLFWLGWIGTCIYFITQLTRKPSPSIFPTDPNTPAKAADEPGL